MKYQVPFCSLFYGRCTANKHLVLVLNEQLGRFCYDSALLSAWAPSVRIWLYQGEKTHAHMQAEALIQSSKTPLQNFWRVFCATAPRAMSRGNYTGTHQAEMGAGVPDIKVPGVGLARSSEGPIQRWGGTFDQSQIRVVYYPPCLSVTCSLLIFCVTAQVQ